jgi:diguanylate cyclase (GGDEF)-like protein/PAS domain S-box-containing protein
MALVRAVLPAGIPLPDDQWARRHRAITGILWMHAVALTVMAFVQGMGLVHSLSEGLLVAVFAVAAAQTGFGGRRLRALSAAAGLVTASAVLVHLSGGMVEMHFHFFVMVAVITLYQDWTIFLAAIVFVAGHHGIVGVLAPHDVYNHDAAWNNPWKWAGIHAAFVLAASAAQITSWRFVEDQYHRAEREIENRDRRFRSLIENSSDGISVIAADGSIVYDSPSVSTVLGYEPGERTGADVFAFIHPDDLARTTSVFSEMLSGQLAGTVSVELRGRHRDGSWRQLEAQVSNLLHADGINGIVANFRDVTERKALEDRLAHRAFHDPLTELPNRALFVERIDHALATQKRTDLALAVLFIDLDDFKTINDGLGHAAGDQVLVAVGERLRAVLRESDTCARLGGDEFGVLLEGLAQPGEAYEVGARILLALADEIVIEGSSLNLNASLGIVVTAGGEEPAELVRNADLAMYQAKSEGKGRYEIFETGMHDAVVERLELKADLRRAIAAEEFVAHYQPIVELSTGRIVGAEALARWHHPDRGVLPPAVFMDLAEESGLIVRIGSAVLAQACRDAARWAADGEGVRSVSVNLSTKQLQDDNVIEEVKRALAETGLDPASLTLEITESLLMEDPARAAETLGRLKALGVELALDDFGTGYSSLSYLAKFPVDRLKIDKSFVDSLAGAGEVNDASLVAAIAGIGEMLNLKVTAEGIECQGQLDELVALGCQFGQGYYYAKPISNSDFSDLLGDRFDVGVATDPRVPADWTITAP